MTLHTFKHAPRKVNVPRKDVESFNRQWPCSTLRATRSYWFEFDESGDLIDTDCPEHDDGPAATAMADDALEFLESGEQPDWIY